MYFQALFAFVTRRLPNYSDAKHNHATIHSVICFSSFEMSLKFELISDGLNFIKPRETEWKCRMAKICRFESIYQMKFVLLTVLTCVKF